MNFKAILFTVTLLACVSTPARADMLQNAIDYVEWSGVTIPPGWTIVEGPASGAPGETIPDGNGGGVIEINPDGINETYPSIDGDAGEFGGVLVVVILHELKHASDPPTSNGEYICDEIVIQHETAASHCSLVCLILGEIPGADVSPLCAMYSDVMNSFNNGVNTPGGASTVAAKFNCPYPGDIGSCECCE